MCGEKVSLVISIHSNAVPNRGYWDFTKTFQAISIEFNIVCVMFQMKQFCLTSIVAGYTENLLV